MIKPVAGWTGHEEVDFQGNELALAVALLGTVLFALFHSGVVRRQVGRSFSFMYGMLRGVFVDLPAALLRLPLTRIILESKPFAICRDFLIKPLVLTGCLSAVFPLYGIGKRPALPTASSVFVLPSLLLNSRW